jgi:putative MATE family efflux protein
MPADYTPRDDENRQTRDWTQGGILRNLLSLSWPMVLTEGFAVTVMTLDIVWVGRLGTTAIAAIGVASMVTMLAMSAEVGLMAGLRAIVARFVGSGDHAAAVHATQQAIALSIFFGIVTTVIGVAFPEELIALFGVEEDVVQAGAGFLRIMSAGMLGFGLRIVADSAMQSSGDTVTPMRITIITRSIHLVLGPFLILGWWIFPAYGVPAAGFLNVLAHNLAAALGLWALLSGRSRLRLTLSGFRLDPAMMWRIIRIGVPALVMTTQRSIGAIVLTWLMAPFGTVALAAHSLVQRVDTVLFLPSWALSAGAGVLVGQNLGARRPDRAERGAWLATALVTGWMAVGSLALLLAAEGITGIFNTEPELVASAAVFLRIAAAGYVVMALVITLGQALSGAGDTVPAMIISVLMVWAVQVPLAFLLPEIGGLGVLGVRWAIVGGTVAGGAAYLVYFRSGRWKLRSV